MKFATLSHILKKDNLACIPKTWIKNNLIISPELDIMGTKGHVVALTLLPQQIMSLPKQKIKHIILDAAVYTQQHLNVELLQLGALTTSVTNGAVWLANQKKYTGIVTHGDSYTAAVTSQTVMKAVSMHNQKPKDLTLAIVGAYGIIGEAVSKILVPDFNHSILIGRRKEKLDELEKKIKGNLQTTLELKTKKADVIVTATSHPTALLESEHLKKNAIIVDVSQPVNLSAEVCKKRPDIFRVDGGYVSFPSETPLPIPGLPPGKTFACIAEVIMQAMENQRENHVGSIDLHFLHKTEKWAQKYGFTLQELTNFGKTIKVK